MSIVLVFIQLSPIGQFTGDLQAEKMRIESHFWAIKEEKIKGALDSLSHKERMRIDDIVEKQAREMLQLLDEKVGYYVIQKERNMRTQPETRNEDTPKLGY